MQGDSQILELLNDVLSAELTAINQYFVHYRMCQNWGYQRLAKKLRADSLEEMNDADMVIERILYLEGVPNMQRLYPVLVGQDAVEMHQLDLELERGNIKRLNDGIAICRDKGDNGTRELLERILKGEEEAADWIEGQLHIIREIGKERYLAQQVHE